MNDHNVFIRNNGYLARQEIEMLIGKIRVDPKRLEPYGYSVYSQGDEDGILDEIFRRLDLNAGSFLEIGVQNGLECNSLLLIHKGWRGVWVEGNLNQRQVILEKFASIIPHRLNLISEMVTLENINSIVNANKIDFSDFDFISIDIDGNDVYLFDALLMKPKVVCIEYNAKFPPNMLKAQVYAPNRAWRGTDYMGTSLKFITEVAIEKGYQLVGTSLTGANAFFVRCDLVQDLFCANCTSENLYNPPRYWLINDHYQKIGHEADFGLYTDLI